MPRRRAIFPVAGSNLLLALPYNGRHGRLEQTRVLRETRLRPRPSGSGQLEVWVQGLGRARSLPQCRKAVRRCLVIVVVFLAVQAGPGGPPSWGGLTAQTSPTRAGGEDPVLLAAGDIASCDSSGDEATAALLDGFAGTVLTLGDTVYQAGTAEEFADCYDPSWGRHKARTRPAVGDHEYNTPGATGYYDYFGAAAGEPGEGYYSYDLGTWHVIALNSNCAEVGGCGPGSPQGRWLRADLAAHPATCTLAVIHHPRFSSGTEHGGNEAVRPLWQALYEAGADVVLSGNEHNYERFAPQDPDGTRDDARGIRQFVVGTGGIGFYELGPAIANSEARNDDALGVLALTLRPGGYDWRFVPVAGQDFSDAGSAACNPVVREVPVAADTGVRRSDPWANLGTAPLLEVDGDPESWSYLRFDVRGTTGAVRSAKLRLFVPPAEGTGRGPAVHTADSAWSGTTTTWNRRPSLIGGPYDAKDEIEDAAWIDFDVTGAVTGDGTYTFALVPRSDDGVRFASRDNFSLRPRLVLTLDPDDVLNQADVPSPEPKDAAPDP